MIISKVQPRFGLPTEMVLITSSVCCRFCKEILDKITAPRIRLIFLLPPMSTFGKDSAIGRLTSWVLVYLRFTALQPTAPRRFIAFMRFALGVLSKTTLAVGALSKTHYQLVRSCDCLPGAIEYFPFHLHIRCCLSRLWLKFCKSWIMVILPPAELQNLPLWRFLFLACMPFDLLVPKSCSR